MKYKITNTTVKAPKLHPKTGADLRSAVERVGHGITIRPNNNEHIIIQTNRSRIFDHVNEGMLRLQRGKFIRIEEIEDVSEVLKNHTLGNKDDARAAVRGSSEDVHAAVENRIARASEMGNDSHEQRGGKETEEAINPDGEPNFVVRADKSFKRKQKVEKPQLSEEVTAEVEK